MSRKNRKKVGMDDLGLMVYSEYRDTNFVLLLIFDTPKLHAIAKMRYMHDGYLRDSMPCSPNVRRVNTPLSLHMTLSILTSRLHVSIQCSAVDQSG